MHFDEWWMFVHRVFAWASKSPWVIAVAHSNDDRSTLEMSAFFSSKWTKTDYSIFFSLIYDQRPSKHYTRMHCVRYADGCVNCVIQYTYSVSHLSRSLRWFCFVFNTKRTTFNTRKWKRHCRCGAATGMIHPDCMAKPPQATAKHPSNKKNWYINMQCWYKNMPWRHHYEPISERLCDRDGGFERVLTHIPFRAVIYNIYTFCITYM